ARVRRRRIVQIADDEDLPGRGRGRGKRWHGPLRLPLLTGEKAGREALAEQRELRGPGVRDRLDPFVGRSGRRVVAGDRVERVDEVRVVPAEALVVIVGQL